MATATLPSTTLTNAPLARLPSSAALKTMLEENAEQPGAPAEFVTWHHAAVFADGAGKRAGMAGDTKLQALRLSSQG